MGATGTGKSTVARQLFLAAAPPRLSIDPAGSSLSRVPGAVTVTGPPARLSGRTLRSAVLERLAEHTDTPTLRYVPGDPMRGDEYDAVYSWAFAHTPRWIWLDEAGIAAPATSTPRAVDRALVQGRKRELGHLACHTRPREVSRNLIAQSQHVLIWQLPNPDDRRHVADQIGLPIGTLDAHLGELEAYGFLWWDQRHRELTICSPV